MTPRKSVPTASTGPDMADVFPFWKELQNCHQVTLKLAIEADHRGRYQGVLKLTWRAVVWEGTLEPGGQVAVEHQTQWPDAEGRTWEAHVYNTLFRLDYLLSLSYKQRQLLLFPAGA